MTHMAHVLSDAAIREQKAALNRAIQEAQAQLADLDMAERIVLRFGREVESPQISDGDHNARHGDYTPQLPVAPAVTSGDRASTTKALMQSVLRGSPSPWMTSDELREQVSALKGTEVPMGTVGPTLSNLKNEGVIVRDGFKVALAERLYENGAASAAPDAEEAPTSSNDSQTVHDLLG